MTKTECLFCKAPATAIKAEADREFQNDGPDVITRVEFPICGACEEANYDGTEDFPGTQPLA